MNHHPSLRAPGLALSLFVFLYWPLFRVSPRFFPAETSADLFADDTLHDVRLYIHSKDLQRLRSGYLENTYYPADLIWRNTRVRNAAVRSRGGAATRDAVKLGFRVDFNRYTPRQTFLGLRALVLDNLFQDRAMMREALAMSVYARMGQPAPREAFCRLYVNNDYQGVYGLVEDIDETFLARTFGEDSGYLFEYQWQQEFFGGPLGSDFGVYRTLFEAKTHELAGDEVLYAPIRALFDLVNAPDETTEREAIDAHIDLEQLVTVAALDTLLGEEDGLAGLHGMNNIYFYREAGSSRHSLIPWDRDRALNLLHTPIFDRVYENSLTRTALLYDDLFDRYLRVLEDGAHLLADGDWLLSEIERFRVLIGAAAYADRRKPYTNDDFDASIEWIRRFAAERPARVLEEVAAYRRAYSLPSVLPK